MSRKIRLLIEVDVAPGYSAVYEEEREWFRDEILSEGGVLVLHSNEVGDEVGPVTAVEIIDAGLWR